MHIMFIHPSDATVTNSTNQDWMMLGLRGWSVYDTYATCNGGYWHIVCIVDSGYPSGQYLRSCYPVLLGTQPYQIWMKIDMVHVECLLI